MEERLFTKPLFYFKGICMAVLAGFGGRVQIAMYPIVGWNTVAEMPGPPQILKANKWSVDFSVDVVDITSTQGAQVTPDWYNPTRLNTKQYLPTVAEITINIEAYYDTEPHSSANSTAKQNWFSYPGTTAAGDISFGLSPGRIASLWLMPAKPEIVAFNNAIFSQWYFQSILITQVSMNIEAKGIVKLSFGGKNNSPVYELYNI